MSKASDSDIFVRLEQERLKKKNLYLGPIDGWPGAGTRDAWRKDHGIIEVPPVVIPPVGDLGDLPKPQEFYVLPRETQSAMTAFYGTPTKSGEEYLAWFSFPCDGIRLYERDGVLLTDKTGDDLPDHRTHRLLAGRLEAALQEIYLTLGDAEFRRQGWHVWGGSHNYRNKTGGSGLSTHSWALADDFNPSENAYAMTTTTFSDIAINIMEKWGFLSGFRAWGRDAMHFQAAIPNLSSGSYYSRFGLPKNIRIAA